MSAGRALHALERKLHQAAVSSPNHTLSQKDVDALAPDPPSRTDAINFLLKTGMLRLMKEPKGGNAYRAVLKKELDVKKDMSGEEAMVLSHIQAAGNEGIWTKHIKAKTELHQTVLDRCLKSLVQKKIIKPEKSVKYPTRKMYMLAHLEPSVELTGGPWYTDNELDTEFIKLLCSACLRFIRDRTFPKTKTQGTSQPLYPISNAPAYPSAGQIQQFLSKSKITETQLSVEHVDMLLNVLVLDGEIEKLPAFAGALWESRVDDMKEDSGSESEDEVKRKKRKRMDKEESERKRKKKRKAESESEDDSGSEERESKRKRKKSKSKASSGESESDSEEDRRKKKKKRKVNKESDEEDKSESDSEEEQSKSKSKSKRRKRDNKKRRRDDSDDSDSESENASDSSSTSRKRKWSRSKSKSRASTKSKRSSSPALPVTDDTLEGIAYVYRAVRQEKVSLGLSQAPCGRCPQFDFCKDGGPVNPKECVYYGEWLVKEAVAAEGI
ncbi:hypothetical protein NEOLEDRAFT_1137326 [Neolentinus lepideus HHB14362 ss-1]|uniref:RNA polymerase Rpc34 n=1 Tax=Neolentinus lepideus HHB14362 ss-1 TaxID=1314782 RepID=A0A165QW95_9AGAM|nr:hypothetical protein NEOLEDRAFT_1137326 [Neolentinus lepideus HHB14362 ss-1]